MTRTTLAAALALAAWPALAQEEHAGHDMAGMDAMGGLSAAMDAMMAATPTESTGDIDADFLLMMIPHHQSAIDMARLVLEQGRDPEVRALAEAVIAVQAEEIAAMRGMLGRLGVEPPPAP